jgi:hypothetical protein
MLMNIHSLFLLADSGTAAAWNSPKKGKLKKRGIF